MLKNHFKTALRSLQKRKGFALINIIGLSLGIWCTLMISLWVMDEFAQDSFHENGDNIYQVLRHQPAEDGSIVTAEDTAYPIADALIAQTPEIKEQTRVTYPRTTAVNISEKMTEVQMIAADPSFFGIFSFPLKEGNSKTCLQDLQNIVISEELAYNFFPEGNVVGKTIEIIFDEVVAPFTVSGVFERLPEQSSLQFDVVIQIENYLPFNSVYMSWGNSWMKTYVSLDDQASIVTVNQKVETLPKEMADVDWFTLYLQPFQDRYLYSKFENGRAQGGRIDYVILFLVIAVFTLLIACFNFINLTTAWSIKRSKEVGIRKVLGAGKRSLLTQFVLESVLLVFVAIAFAVLLAIISISEFNTIAAKNLFVNFNDPRLYGILGLIAFLTVLLSGIYPALLLSSFNAKNALQGKLKANLGPTVLRKGLVVVQFGLSMILVAGTLVVYFQLNFIQNKNLGLDKENVLIMPMDINIWKHGKAVISELAKFPNIKEVSASSGNFIESIGISGDPVWEGKNPNASNPGFAVLDVDFGLIEMLNIDVVKGRSFKPTFATDTLNYLVNEKAARVMGLENPLEKSLKFWGEEGGKIIGVVKDFHFTSLHNPIDPMIVRCRPKEPELIYVKALPGKIKETIAQMQVVHEQFSSLPFNYSFLDQTIKQGYEQEQRIQQLASIFAVLAIFISCLGLFGLAAFTVNQRTREIAVRKVLGANIMSLFNMLSKDFIKLIGMAILIAFPITWYAMNDWIQGFAYRIDIGWWMFAIAGLAVILIALLTVTYQTLKAAKANPSKSLRTE